MDVLDFEHLPFDEHMASVLSPAIKLRLKLTAQDKEQEREQLEEKFRETSQLYYRLLGEIKIYRQYQQSTGDMYTLLKKARAEAPATSL